MNRSALFCLVTFLMSLGCQAPYVSRRELSLLTPGSLDGWHPTPGGRWFWEGDVLVGTSPKSEKAHGVLVTDRRFTDFEATLVFRTVSGCSGFYFRIDEVEGDVAVAGLQAEVEGNYETGGLYETKGRGWVLRADEELVRSVYQPGEWTEMTVRAIGRDIEVSVNGTTTAVLLDDPGRTEGHLGLQLHGSQEMRVEFRSLTVRGIASEEQ